MASEELLLEGAPLSAIFERADQLFHGSLEQDASSSDGQMKECASLLQECARRVRQMALFSPNEELDDVSTADIKYLLVPWMHADVAYRMPSLQRDVNPEGRNGNPEPESRYPFSAPSPDAMASLRLQVLKGVLLHLEEFLLSCDRLQLLSKEERASLLGTSGVDGVSVTLDPAMKRNVKVARFKKEKELRQRLETLKARRAAARRIRIRRGVEGRQQGHAAESENSDGTTSPKGPSDADEKRLEEDSFLDEADERQLWVTELQSAWVKATDLEQTVKREEEMLRSAQRASQGQPGGSVGGQPLTRDQLERSLKEREESHRRAAEQARKGAVGPSAATITCATLAQDVIEGRAGPTEVTSHRHTPIGLGPLAFGPVSLMGGANPNMGGGIVNSLGSLTARQAASSKVFQPSHSLPSMSIEEAGLREMRMMERFQNQVKGELEEQGMQVRDGQGGQGGGGRGGGGAGGGRREITDIGLEGGPALEEESEDEDERDSDAAVMKARNWDDWKDENPRGKGNSKLTPCG